MSIYRVAYTKRQVYDMGFPSGEYVFPEGEGSFIGTLVMKKWRKHNGIICYFDALNGEKYKLIVWFSYDDSRTFCPLNSKVDMSYLDFGSVVKVTYSQTKNGKSKWLDAEVLHRA